MDTESEKRYAERPSATDRVGEEAKAMMVGPEKATDDVEGNPRRPGERRVGWPKRLILTSDVNDYPTALIANADFVINYGGAVIKHHHGDADRQTCKTLDPMDARRLVDEAAWRGYPPAEGTRRAIILEAVKRGDVLSDTEALEIADTVESALLRAALGDEAMVRGAEALTDGIVEVDLEANRMGRSVAGEEAAKALNHLIIARRECADPAELARINEAITAAHMVVEPPVYAATAEAVCEEVGEDAPTDYEKLVAMPEGLRHSERLLWEEGNPTVRKLLDRISRMRGCEESERLLGEREEARTREGRFAEERDCAYALLRWLLPVTVAKRLD